MEYSRDQIKEIVASSVARSLACEIKEVTEDGSLVDDLGMDSLDFLDVIFSLEKTFQIKLLGQEINRLLRPDKSKTEEEQDTNLSMEEIDKLAPFIPSLEATVAERGSIPRLDLFKMVTTGSLVAMVSNEINKNTDTQ